MRVSILGLVYGSVGLFLGLCSVMAQSPSRAQRIQAVENNLMPYVSARGFAGWNIEARMKHYKVQGLSIAVIRNFEIDWAKGYGMADTARKMPVTTNTMFSAGSISKLVMAAAALQMADQGKIALDAPINQYLKSWQIPENDFTRQQPPTLRMLLSHTAGTSQQSYFGFTPDKQPLPSIVEILSGAAIAESRGVVVNSLPGAKQGFRYSGGGSMIAQLALMDIEGADFETIIQKRIFAPLRMTSSTFAQPLPPRFAPQAAWGYSAAPWYKGMPYLYPQQAAAGLYATPSDLARFFIDLQKSYHGKGKILSTAMFKEMTQTQANVSEGFYKEQIAVGPFLLQKTNNASPKGVYFEFTGANAGFLAFGIASLTEGNGVVIMFNSGDATELGKEIRRAVAKAYQWQDFLPTEINPVKLSPQTLDKYAGRYRRGINEVVSIRREQDYLIERINEGEDIYCFPVEQDSVVFSDFNVGGKFYRDAVGNITGLRTEWQTTMMPKMRDDEFVPNELLQMGRYEDAKVGLRQMNLNEYQITYLAYEMYNKKPVNPLAVKAILEVALEQHPNAGIVHSRWAIFHEAMGDIPAALASCRRWLELEPDSKEAQEAVARLSKR